MAVDQTTEVGRRNLETTPHPAVATMEEAAETTDPAMAETMLLNLGTTLRLSQEIMEAEASTVVPDTTVRLRDAVMIPGHRPETSQILDDQCSTVTEGVVTKVVDLAVLHVAWAWIVEEMIECAMEA